MALVDVSGMERGLSLVDGILEAKSIDGVLEVEAKDVVDKFEVGSSTSEVSRSCLIVTL